MRHLYCVLLVIHSAIALAPDTHDFREISGDGTGMLSPHEVAHKLNSAPGSLKVMNEIIRNQQQALRKKGKDRRDDAPDSNNRNVGVDNSDADDEDDEDNDEDNHRRRDHHVERAGYREDDHERASERRRKRRAKKALEHAGKSAMKAIRVGSPGLRGLQRNKARHDDKHSTSKATKLAQAAREMRHKAAKAWKKAGATPSGSGKDPLQLRSGESKAGGGRAGLDMLPSREGLHATYETSARARSSNNDMPTKTEAHGSTAGLLPDSDGSETEVLPNKPGVVISATSGKRGKLKVRELPSRQKEDTDDELDGNDDPTGSLPWDKGMEDTDEDGSDGSKGASKHHKHVTKARNKTRHIRPDKAPPSFSLIKSDAECTSPDLNLDPKEESTERQCAAKCAKNEGCHFFASGKGQNTGRCYWEKTKGAHCPEGWLKGAYNFYRVDPPDAAGSRHEKGHTGLRHTGRKVRAKISSTKPNLDAMLNYVKKTTHKSHSKHFKKSSKQKAPIEGKQNADEASKSKMKKAHKASAKATKKATKLGKTAAKVSTNVHSDLFPLWVALGISGVVALLGVLVYVVRDRFSAKVDSTRRHWTTSSPL